MEAPDAPVGANGLCGAPGGEGGRGDEEPRLLGSLASVLGAGDGPDQAGQGREAGMARIAPVLVGEQPADVAADAGLAGLDAAVILVDGLYGLNLALGRGGEVGLDVGMQRRLVALERQQVIGPCLGDLVIGGDGVDGDERALDGQPLQDDQDAGAVVLLSLDRLLGQDELLA